MARFNTGNVRGSEVRGGTGAGYPLTTTPGDLVLVEGAPTFTISLWLFTHTDLRNVANARVFLRLVGDVITERLAMSPGG